MNFSKLLSSALVATFLAAPSLAYAEDVTLQCSYTRDTAPRVEQFIIAGDARSVTWRYDNGTALLVFTNGAVMSDGDCTAYVQVSSVAYAFGTQCRTGHGTAWTIDRTSGQLTEVVSGIAMYGTCEKIEAAPPKL
ncbi:MAG: hypothetical protein WCA81_06280 [Rhizomicrobium sp.]